MNSTQRLTGAFASSQANPPAASQLLASTGVILVAVLMLLVGLLTIPYIWSRPYFGYVFDAESGRVLEVAPGSPATRANIKVGDYLTHVDGIFFRDARPLYRDKRIGDTVQYTLTRDGQPYQAPVRIAASPLQVLAGHLMRLVLGAVFWLLGVTVFVRRRQDEVAQTFLLMCASAAGALWLIPLSTWQVDWARRLLYLAILLAGLGFLHFHLVFPLPVAERQRRPLLRALYLLAGACALLSLVVGPFRLADWTREILGTGTLPGNLLRLYFVATALAGLYFLTSSYRAGSGTARRRIRLVVISTVLGCLPLLLYFIAVLVGYFNAPYDLAIIGLILIPISYTISINQSDLMVVDAVLYRILIFLIVGLLLLIGYLALITLAGYVSPHTTQTPLTGAFASLVLVAGYSTVRKQVQVSLDRIFYGRAYDYMDVLVDSTRILVDHLDEVGLVEVLTERITAAMDVAQSGVWIIQPDGQLRWVGGQLAPTSTDPLLQSADLLKRLKRGELIQLSLEHSQLPELLPLSGPVRWLVPLVLDKELQGLWVVGPRLNDESFSPVDHQLMNSAASQAALVIKVSQLLERLRHQLHQSESDRRELREAYARLVTTREAERTRLSRELHDGVLQDLYGFDWALESARAEAPAALDERLRAIQAHAQHMMAETRRICQGLRPVTLEKFGLERALYHLAEDTTARSTVEVEVEVTPFEGHTTPETELALYRISQETINNAIKHAQAQHIRLQLEMSGQALTLSAQDDGIGFDLNAVEGKRSGIIGMRERVAAFGGKLEIETAIGRGTTIRVSIPLSENSESHLHATA
jgi:signal transduction histidine kinase